MEEIRDDDGWTGCGEIRDHAGCQGLKNDFPRADPEVVQVFQHLVDTAKRYRDLTARHLDIFGELGELYAEIKFGIKRHRCKAAGSDGRLGNDFIEIKTIGPGNRSKKVRVKRSGNFNKLIVVRIDDGFDFRARTVERKMLRKGEGKWFTVSWSSLASDAQRLVT